MRYISLFLASLPLIGQSLPYESSRGASYHQTDSISARYGRCAEGKRPDFPNMTFSLFEDPVKLVKGRMSKTETEDGHFLGSVSVDLVSVHPLPHGDGRERYWLVLLFVESVGGSTSQSYTAQVFRCGNGELRVVQQIAWDARTSPRKSPVSIDLQTGDLRFATSHYQPGDAHCCVSAQDEVSYDWRGGRYRLEKVVARRLQDGERP